MEVPYTVGRESPATSVGLWCNFELSWANLMKLGDRLTHSCPYAVQFLIPGNFSLCATYSRAIDFVGIP